MNETQMVEERLRSFLAVPEDADWQDVVRRAEEEARRVRAVCPRRRLALAALAACLAAAAAAVGFSGVLTSAPPTSTPTTKGHGIPPGYSPMNLSFTRNGQTVTSLAVTVNASFTDGTLQLQVLHGNPYGPTSGPAPDRQVVFQEQEPMTNIASPSSGAPGTEALSTWSGTLSPSEWTGGCQQGQYEVWATVVPAGSSFTSPLPDGSESSGSQWFTCQ